MTSEDQIKELTKQCDDLRAICEQLQSENDQMAIEYRELGVESKKNAEAHAETVRALEQQRAELKRQYDAVVKENHKARAEVDARGGKIDDLLLKLKQSNDRNTELEKNCDGLTAELDKNRVVVENYKCGEKKHEAYIEKMKKDFAQTITLLMSRIQTKSGGEVSRTVSQFIDDYGLVVDVAKNAPVVDVLASGAPVDHGTSSTSRDIASDTSASCGTSSTPRDVDTSADDMPITRYDVASDELDEFVDTMVSSGRADPPETGLTDAVVHTPPPPKKEYMSLTRFDRKAVVDWIDSIKGTTVIGTDENLVKSIHDVNATEKESTRNLIRASIITYLGAHYGETPGVANKFKFDGIGSNPTKFLEIIG